MKLTQNILKRGVNYVVNYILMTEVLSVLPAPTCAWYLSLLPSHKDECIEIPGQLDLSYPRFYICIHFFSDGWI